MSEYMPTTERVRHDYGYATGNGGFADHRYELQFDRWLSAHDAATRTAALEEAAWEWEYRRVNSGGRVYGTIFDTPPELDEGMTVLRRAVGPWEPAATPTAKVPES